MWVKDMPANKNVELLVEKLLDEELGRMVQEQSEDESVEGGEEEIVGIGS